MKNVFNEIFSGLLTNNERPFQLEKKSVRVIISDLGLCVEHHVTTRHGRAGGLAIVVQVTVLQVGWTILY